MLGFSYRSEIGTRGLLNLVKKHLDHQNWKKLILSKISSIKLYGKCSKISNTLKLRTPKIITENNF